MTALQGITQLRLTTERIVLLSIQHLPLDCSNTYLSHLITDHMGRNNFCKFMKALMVPSKPQTLKPCTR